MNSDPSRWMAKMPLALLSLALAAWTPARGAATEPAAGNSSNASTQPSAAPAI